MPEAHRAPLERGPTIGVLSDKHRAEKTRYGFDKYIRILKKVLRISGLNKTALRITSPIGTRGERFELMQKLGPNLTYRTAKRPR
jgi:hypothetical protein